MYKHLSDKRPTKTKGQQMRETKERTRDSGVEGILEDNFLELKKVGPWNEMIL